MKRSMHSLSHYRLTTTNFAKIYPIACMEVLPGDTFKHSVRALIRATPLVTPVMHPVHVHVHSWFVPFRLLWEGWEDFATGIDTATACPTITCNLTDPAGLLANAMGAGIGATNVTLNALYFRAYNKIWNEYYRDQDIMTPVTEDFDDTDDKANYAILDSAWQKDYFTVARSNPQQGANTAVVGISLSGTIPVRGIGILSTDNTPADTAINVKDSRQTTPQFARGWNPTADQTSIEAQGGAPTWYPNVRVDMADLAGGTLNMSINDWRQAMAKQKRLEHRNRFGSRYTDFLRYWGITPSDARLDRPEYLGGGKQTISFSEVLSTAETTGANVGDLAGHGIAALKTRPYKRFFEEHGTILTFMVIRPVAIYANAIPRRFLRSTAADFFQVEDVMMGDQPVLLKEVYGNTANPNTVFGYIRRHDDYRREHSQVTGKFLDATMDEWHLARMFTSDPALNTQFLKCDASNRVFSTTTVDQFQVMAMHTVKALRVVPKSARN